MTKKRALLIKLGQIGDVIMAIPAAYALHQRGFEIDWVCGRNIESLLQCYSWIHPIPVDDKALQFGSFFVRARTILNIWQKLAFRKFDLCAILYYDIRYRVITLPVRTTRTLIFSNASRSTSLLSSRHHTDEYRRFLLETEDGCLDHSARPVLPDRLPPPPISEKAAPRRIAIVPGGVKHLIHEQASGRVPDQALRRWPIENFVQVARVLVNRGWEVVLVGGPEDSWVKQCFIELTVHDCIGRLSLPEVISMCNSCDAVITHDTGPLHLAGLSDASIIGIFGPTDPATRVPRRDYSVGLWGGMDFACRPCYNGREFAPCRFNGCMHKVTPEAVLYELDQLINVRTQGQIAPWRIVFPEAQTSCAFREKPSS